MSDLESGSTRTLDSVNINREDHNQSEQSVCEVLGKGIQ